MGYQVCTKIRIYPRDAVTARMNSAKIYGSNTSPTADRVLLGSITGLVEGAWNTYSFSNSTEYKYLIVANPDNYCELTELEFLTSADVVISRAAIVASAPFDTGFEAVNGFDSNTSTPFAATPGGHIGIECVLTDTTKPSDVTGLSGSAASPTQINLDWDNATDNVAVTDYRVYYNTSNSHTAESTSDVGGSTSAKNITGLSPGTTYYFWVKAKDAAGNFSENYSSVATISTPPTINTSSPLNSTNVGASFAQTLAKSGAAGTWEIRSGAPSGMTINSSTGEITWEPGSIGTFSDIVVRFTVTASGLYDEETYSITVGAAEPLEAAFTIGATSYNSGATVSATDGTTGGFGAKTRVWKADGSVITPSNGNYTSPTFAGLAPGTRTIRLEVTDESGTDAFEDTVFIGTLSGSGTVANSSTATYTTNVSSPTWSVTSGDGSINSGGVFTAPSSGMGRSTLRAINGENFATKEIIWGIPKTVTLGNVETYTSSGLIDGQAFKARVRARDEAGNWSGWSDWEEAETT